MLAERALVISANADTVRALACLEEAGLEVLSAGDAFSALRMTYEQRPDLLLVSLDVAGVGIELHRLLSEMTSAPIIAIGPSHRRRELIHALENGVDEFITEPFTAPEVTVRALALLRYARESQMRTQPSTVRLGDLVIDLDGHRVTKRGQVIRLTPLEFGLLAVLMEYRGRVVAHRTLLTRVWGAEAVTHRHYLRLYIGYLRAKLEDNPRTPTYIITDRGRGYRIGAVQATPWQGPGEAAEVVESA